MIQQITSLVPSQLINELRQLTALPEPWMSIEIKEPPLFQCHLKTPGNRLPPLVAAMLQISKSTGADLCGLLAISMWVKDCPRIVRPSREQAESMMNISLEIELKDYSQPFPAVVVETPGNKVFKAVLCYQYSPSVLCLNLFSHNSANDIVTMIRQTNGGNIERSLERLSPCDNLESILAHSLSAQRLAMNMLLSLMTFGHKEGYAFPKQVEADRTMAKEDSERGRRAKSRVENALVQLDFTHTIVIRHSPPKPNDQDKQETDRTTKPHWVRGHWKMQPCGTGLKERKRILIAPYLTHAELWTDTPIPGVVYVDRR